jgi:hypothetical protein
MALDYRVVDHADGPQVGRAPRASPELTRLIGPVFAGATIMCDNYVAIYE